MGLMKDMALGGLAGSIGGGLYAGVTASNRWSAKDMYQAKDAWGDPLFTRGGFDGDWGQRPT